MPCKTPNNGGAAYRAGAVAVGDIIRGISGKAACKVASFNVSVFYTRLAYI